jgi:hypothetical protein
MRRDTMRSPDRIVYTPRSDTSPELEAAALAAVYRYILDCHEEKKAVEASGAEDGMEGGDDEHRREAASD